MKSHFVILKVGNGVIFFKKISSLNTSSSLQPSPKHHKTKARVTTVPSSCPALCTPDWLFWAVSTQTGSLWEAVPAPSPLSGLLVGCRQGKQMLLMSWKHNTLVRTSTEMSLLPIWGERKRKRKKKEKILPKDRIQSHNSKALTP